MAEKTPLRETGHLDVVELAVTRSVEQNSALGCPVGS